MAGERLRILRSQFDRLNDGVVHNRFKHEVNSPLCIRGNAMEHLLHRPVFARLLEDIELFENSKPRAVDIEDAASHPALATVRWSKECLCEQKPEGILA